jgi:hypothetical protein
MLLLLLVSSKFMPIRLETVREGGEASRSRPKIPYPKHVSHARFGEYPGMALPVYPSDLSDAEWAVLASLLPSAKPGGRPRSVNIRRIVNGLFYLVRSGCAWRYLPRDYGPWSTV